MHLPVTAREVTLIRPHPRVPIPRILAHQEIRPLHHQHLAWSMPTWLRWTKNRLADHIDMLQQASHLEIITQVRLESLVQYRLQVTKAHELILDLLARPSHYMRLEIIKTTPE